MVHKLLRTVLLFVLAVMLAACAAPQARPSATQRAVQPQATSNTQQQPRATNTAVAAQPQATNTAVAALPQATNTARVQALPTNTPVTQPNASTAKPVLLMFNADG